MLTEAPVDDEGLEASQGDLRLALSRLANLDKAKAGQIIHAYGATLTSVVGVHPDRIADCIRDLQAATLPLVKPIQESHPTPDDPHADHRSSTYLGRHTEDISIIQHIMNRWEPEGLFESKTVQQYLYDMGYNATSHGPALSELTSMGLVVSLGNGVFHYTLEDPRGLDLKAKRRELTERRALARAQRLTQKGK